MKFVVWCWDVVVVLCFAAAYLVLFTCWRLLSPSGKEGVCRGFEATIRTHIANAAAGRRKDHTMQDDQTGVTAQAFHAQSGPASRAHTN